MFEVGIVFRGFVLTKYNFKEIPSSKISGTDSDLRGAFISAINTFAEKTFINSALEYLELENFL
ncbi:MAG: hypothetical protein GF317_16545, partial [Candidatus Lokiarchaeota archaeon]|nr:hypothetical protein [Candidatus Lokiarchaeota archaeon]MBD3201129.1 hypothetical protein [Candidatus Lokiarchaeota archaeon]